MTSTEVNGDGTAKRTGAHALALLMAPLNASILHSVATGPKLLAELKRELGSPPRRALRAQLKVLERIGAIVKRGGPLQGPAEYKLAEPGRELRFVASALEGWLHRADEPLELDSEAGRAATGALAQSWSSALLRSLAEAPRSAAELSDAVTAPGFPSVERQLAALHLAELVEAVPQEDGDQRYAARTWLRQGVSPIAAGARWEQRNMPWAAPEIDRVDAEMGLLLAIPAIPLPAETSGSCRLVVEFPEGASEPGVVSVLVESGKVVRCSSPGEGGDSWARGDPTGWFRAAIEANFGQLDLGGDGRLTWALLNGLFELLFGLRALKRSWQYL